MTLRHLLSIVNLRVQVVSLSPLFLGNLAVLVRGHRLSWPELILMALASVAIGMGTTAWNTYSDFVRGVDSEEYERDPDRVLVTGATGPGHAFLTALVLFAFGIAAGLVLAVLVGGVLVPVGAGCVAVALFYSGGPYPLSRTPLGEVVVALAQGTVLFCLTYFVQTREFSPEVLVLSVPSAFFVALILTVNNNCDRIGDRAAGRWTLSILLGPRYSRWLVPGLAAAGYGAGLAACGSGILGWGAAVPLAAALGGSVPLVLKMDRRGYSHGTKGPNMGSVLFLFQLFTAAMAAALVTQLF